MPDTLHKSDHIETATDPAAFADWPGGLYEEMLANSENGCVGSVLVSETEALRVWHLHLAPGERCNFHRHVNPYFWTALTAGKARSYFSSGKIAEAEYFAGETRHFFYGPGEYMLHSLENIGDTTLTFVTVEHLDHEGTPLPVPDSVRLNRAS